MQALPDLTLGAALLAGLVSFLSPCVLPVVPAYLGQLGAFAVTNASATPTAAEPPGRSGMLAVAGGPAIAAVVPSPSLAARRWAVLPHALAFVLGFTAVFTTLGITASYALGGLGPQLPLLRQIGGVILVILGLNMAGVLSLSALARSWRPLDAFEARRGPVASRTPLGAFGLGSVFALGWTPCIGPTLGAIFGLALAGPTAQAGSLFVAYSIGLGLPFLGLALALDRAPGLIRPLLRHTRTVEIIGGVLVALIGLAIVFDWLGFFYRSFGTLFFAI